jgi:hypothetical protein
MRDRAGSVVFDSRRAEMARWPHQATTALLNGSAGLARRSRRSTCEPRGRGTRFPNR